VRRINCDTRSLRILRSFTLARRLGRFAGDPDGQDAWSCHAAELNGYVDGRVESLTSETAKTEQ
jgi:hypothetical protein